MGIIAPKTTIVNPPTGVIDEFRFQASEYGSVLPQPRGTVRLGGQVVWLSEIRREKRTTRTETGGKGGGAKTTTIDSTFLYFADMAIKFAEQPSFTLLKLFADKKLVYDNTGSGQAQNIDLVLRFYDGREDQQPDSVIETSTGTDNAPAFRGSTVIVIENLDLSNFGGRIPVFEAVISFEEPTSVQDIVTVTAGAVLSESIADSNADFFVQQNLGEIYGSTDDRNGFVVVSMDTLAESRRVVVEEGSLTFDVDGVGLGTNQVYGQSQVFDVVGSRYRRVNRNTGSITSTTSQGNTNVFGQIMDMFFKPHKAKAVVITEDTTGDSVVDRYVLREANYDFIRALTKQTGYSLSRISRAGDGFGVFGLEWNASEINVIFSFVFGDPEEDSKIARVNTFSLANLNVSNISNVSAPLHDPVSNSLFFAIDTGSDVFMYKWKIASLNPNVRRGLIAPKNPSSAFNNSTIEWVTQVPFMPSYQFGESRLRGNDLVWMSGQNICRISIATGVLDDDLNGTGDVAGISLTGPFWDDARRSLFGFASDRLYKITLGGTAQPVDMATYVEDLAEKHGLELWEDIDAAGVSGVSIDGINPGETPGSGILDTLETVYLFDVRETGGQIAMVQRGGSSVDTIVEDDDMVPTNASFEEAYFREVLQSSEIPYRIELEFTDPVLDYQNSTQSAQRHRSVITVVQSEDTDTIDAKILTMSADEARQRAEQLLYVAWTERNLYKIRVPFEFIRIDPADIVTLSLNAGDTIRGRVVEATVGQDLSVELEVRQEEDDLYSSTITTDSGSVPAKSVNIVGNTEIFMLDTPLLRAVDASPDRSYSRYYWAGALNGSESWVGGTLYKSADGENEDPVSETNNAAAWGLTTSVLGDPASPHRTDRVNSVDIQVVNGINRFASVTELQVRNGSNALALIKTNGDIEILQFQTVTHLGNDTIRISNLARGQNGTEVFAYSHTTGETAVLLDIDSIRAQRLDVSSELNVAFDYKLVTFGDYKERLESEPFTSTGNDLRPWAPVHVTTTLDGGNNIDLTWKRRVRYGGSLQDGSDTIPLHEDSELYDLEIRDAAGSPGVPGGSLVRSFIGLTSTAVQYDNADIITDFGSIPSTLHVVVYQRSSDLSANSGRGFPGVYSLEVG